MNIKELCDRYNLNSRKSLYTRLNGLGIKLGKKNNKSYATEEQIALLDQQNEHIKKGGSIENFEPVKLAEVTVLKDTASHIHSSTTQHSESLELQSFESTTQHNSQLTTQEELLGDIVAAIASLRASTEGLANKLPPKNPLWYMHELEIAIANNWQLSTSQIKEMIGVKPRGETFKHGCFIFSKCGKINRESAWRVTKETDNNSSKL